MNTRDFHSARKEGVLSTATFEKLAKSWGKALRAGSLPEIDLGSYSLFDPAALINLLVFAYAAKKGLLVGECGESIGATPPLPLILPRGRSAQLALFRLRFFKFSAYEELFVHANEIRKEERRLFPDEGLGVFASLPDESSRRLPFLPFTRIVESPSSDPLRENFATHGRSFLFEFQATFSAVFLSELGFPLRFCEGFWQPTKELLENIYRHSGSWGVGCIQILPRGVVLVYADAGCGVRQSLQKAGEDHQLSSDAEAIAAAFQEGVTSLPGKSPGFGLPISRRFVVENGGTLQYRSGSARLVIGPQNTARFYECEHMPGVQVRLFFGPKGKL